MKKTRWFSAWLALAAACTFAGPPAAYAQEKWPSRSIKLVVPYPPGGGADLVARSLGEALYKRMGQPIVIDNRAGGTGTIGAAAVAKSAADGYTLLLNQPGPGVTALYTLKSLSYNPLRDLAPVILMGKAPIVVLVPANSPYRTMDDLVKYAKAHPSELNYGSPGIGTAGHIAGEMLQQLAGIKLNHIPYKGSASTANGLMGGQIALGFDTIPPNLSLVQSGRLHALAVASDVRSPNLPEVPHGAEVSLPGFEVYTWYAISGPAGLPGAVVDTLNHATNEWIASDEGRKRLDELGILPQRGGTPEAFASFLQTEARKTETVVRAAHIVSE
ncbi:Tripartite tricarboxylate transporter family receptor [Pigmentiphaga humi]|uniref:Tripartite tricarboxylate transporter family receptor n=1 Tax=Pigmentiphaga humi TaxID=2478468 RepID=A0A3P4B4Y6_9BURK|nr:tripartite tricarboxylate transporter substrate binding protein [Pigmentiphaga humi]VCU71357.1 Tripartite tricarboxylate transporter family receptor [Pigmentiphaga humi]